MAAGWGRVRRDGPLLPFVAKISNYDPATGVFGHFAAPTFEGLSGSAFHLTYVGQAVAKERLADIRKTIRKGVKRNVSPFTLAQCLINGIQGVAATNTTVGRNIMLCIIPRIAAEKGQRGVMVPLVASSLREDEVMAFRVGTDDRWGIESATYVCHGMIIATPVAQMGPAPWSPPPGEVARMAKRLGQPPEWPRK